MNVKLNLNLIQNEMAQFRTDIQLGRADKELIDRMKKGWVNSYAANSEYCEAILKESFSHPAQVLECGSGFTTILLTICAQEFATNLIVFENSAQWVDVVRRSLRFLKLPFDHIHHLPLKNFAEFDWYDVAPVKFSAATNLVVCDGPPGKTRGGRVGLLPVLSAELAANCIILVDDAERPGEEEVLQIWRRDFAVECTKIAGKHSYARVVYNPPG